MVIFGFRQKGSSRHVALIRNVEARTGKRNAKIDVTGLPFLSYVDRSRLPKTSAIYFVLQGDHLLYIGRASNLHRRWIGNGHCKHEIFSRLRSVVIAWYETRDTKTLEKRLIRTLRPTFNKYIPKRCESPKPHKRFGVDWLYCKCERCGHEWISRRGVPLVCPARSCHSPAWNRKVAA